MKRTIKLKSMNLDPAIWFFGTDEDIAKAEKAEAQQAAKLEKIIFSPDFQQLTYITTAGAIRSLHRSTCVLSLGSLSESFIYTVLLNGCNTGCHFFFYINLIKKC